MDPHTTDDTVALVQDDVRPTIDSACISTNSTLIMHTSKSTARPSASSSTGQSAELKIMALNDTKAGMQGLDVDKINQIIQQASKGSKFYEHKKQRQMQLDQKIDEMKKQADAISSDEIRRSEKQVSYVLFYYLRQAKRATKI
jgi:hypothetical protein